jgi:hypothetical protein
MPAFEIIGFFRQIAEIVVPPSISRRGGDITSKVTSARAAASTLDYAGHDSASRNYTVTGSVRHPLSQWTAFACAGQNARSDYAEISGSIHSSAIAAQRIEIYRLAGHSHDAINRMARKPRRIVDVH